jgi:hypothetical protein
VRRHSSFKKSTQGGGSVYATSAPIDHGIFNQSGGLGSYYNNGSSGLYGGYGGDNEAASQNQFDDYNPNQSYGTGSNPDVKKLSKNISEVIADLRAKLRRNLDKSNSAPPHNRGNSNSQNSGYGLFGKKPSVPKHYGGYHRSSFLNRLRARRAK